MRNAKRRGLQTTLVLLGVASVAVPAGAQTLEEYEASCAAGFEQAQVSKSQGRLKDARQALLQCAQMTCSRVVQEQCAAWLDDVEKQIPSVVVQATADGEDRSDVAITIDGSAVDDAPGKAIQLDPGEHTFVFSYGQRPPIKKKIILNDGEKLRPIAINFDTPKASGSGSTSTAAAPTLKHYERPVPAVSYVLAGLAVVGGGAFTYLGLSAKARRDELERDCSPDCSADDVKDLETRSVAANISLAVGGAALGGALISYLLRPSVAVERGPVAAQFLVSPTAASVRATLTF
jgi:hypothetical protein